MDLPHLEALAEKATKRPWHWSGARPDAEGEQLPYIPQGSYLGDTLITLGDTYEESREDCAFVEALVNAWPELRDAVRERAAINDAVAGWVDVPLKPMPLLDAVKAIDAERAQFFARSEALEAALRDLVAVYRAGCVDDNGTVERAERLLATELGCERKGE